MYCNRCGAHLPAEAAFCPSCGCRVSAQAAEIQRAEIPIRESKRGGRLQIGALAAVAAALVLCVLGLFFVLQNHRQEQQSLAADTAVGEAAAEDHAETAQVAESDEASDSADNTYYYYGENAAVTNDYYDNAAGAAYLWPTDTQYISAQALEGLNQDTVAAIRNEIYARHGYAFTTARWQNYFSARSWYHRDSSCTANTIDGRLSDLERENIETLVDYEVSQGWRTDS